MSKKDLKRQRIMKLIAELWDTHPEQRLGQLLWNYGFKDDKKVFAMPDKQLEWNLRRELELNKKKVI